MSLKSKIKDRVTDVIGVIIWGVTIYMLICKGISWWPDSCIGFAIGALMFYVPDEWITKYLKEWIKKKFDVK